MRTVGERIKYIREQYNLSQAEFADKLLIKQALLSHIEVGRRTATANVLRRLQDSFGASIDWVSFGKGEPFNMKSEIFIEKKPVVKFLTDYEILKLIIETVNDCMRKRGDELSSVSFAKLVVEYYKYYVEEDVATSTTDMRKIIDQSYVMSVKILGEKK